MYGFYFIHYYYYFLRQRRRSGVSVVNIKHISQTVMVFP